MFSLESPHRGDSNEYTQYTIFNMNKKDTINYPKSAAMGFLSKGLKNEFETAVVNEPSVFEPLKFYCINDLVKYCMQHVRNGLIILLTNNLKNYKNLTPKIVINLKRWRTAIEIASLDKHNLFRRHNRVHE